MKKAIIAITGAAILSVVASAPASAFAPLFFAPMLASKEDKNFKAVNPYDKKAMRQVKHKRAKR